MKLTPSRYAKLLYQATHAAKPSEMPLVLRAFVQLLAQNKSLSLLPRIVTLYTDYYNRTTKVSDLTVTSARALKPEMLTSLTKLFPTNTVEKVNRVEEAVLGGIALKLNNDQYNMTLHSHLTHLFPS